MIEGPLPLLTSAQNRPVRVSQLAPCLRAIFAKPGRADNLKVVLLAAAPAEQAHTARQKRLVRISPVKMLSMTARRPVKPAFIRENAYVPRLQNKVNLFAGFLLPARAA